MMKSSRRNGLLELVPAKAHARDARKLAGANGNGNGHHGRHAPPPPPDPEALRQVGWEVGARKPAEAFAPPANHVGLAAVTPHQGFAHWRIVPGWIDQTARHKGEAWHHCRLILRVYDVSFIQFNGLNANQVHDYVLPAVDGQYFFKLPRPGTWQLAEVGFLLRGGEFLAAARSLVVHFPADSPSPRGDHAALLVTDQFRIEEVGNIWDHEKILAERRRPKLRQPLRVAAFALGASALGHPGSAARFVTELAAGQRRAEHDVHVFLPAWDAGRQPREVDGVHYHPLEVGPDGSPIEVALRFARAAEERMRDLPDFDLFHVHDWMAGLAPWLGTKPTVLSLGSIEAVRRNGTPLSELSLEIQRAERDAAHAADLVLVPEWLRDRAVADLGLDGTRVHAFGMEGRVPNEWEAPLDYGKVKMTVGVGPLDRLILFVGPLEHAAGVDVLLEALPVLTRRFGNLRVAFAGAGNMYGHLEQRMHQLGVAHAVRLLGHVDGSQVARLVRSAEALVLPSRYRVPFDDAVVDLARRAGRPVVTTTGGPAHLVRHEENGLVTYDNPGSMVWAVDRILGDPSHAEQMGRAGRRGDGGGSLCWAEVARHYLDLCAGSFPELTEARE